MRVGGCLPVACHQNLTARLPAPRRRPGTGPAGRRSDQVSAVVLMARADLARVAPLWLRYSEAVRNDPLAWNETGDEYAKNASMKPWIAGAAASGWGGGRGGRLEPGWGCREARGWWRPAAPPGERY